MYNYRLYDNNVLVGTYKTREISEITGIRPRDVAKYANENSICKKRYRIEKVEEEFISTFKEEWDKYRLMILNSKLKMA